MSEYTKLDRIWDAAKFLTRESFSSPPSHYMCIEDARKLFAQGKNLERMVEELKVHCIKNDTAYYDEHGEFNLKGEYKYQIVYSSDLQPVADTPTFSDEVEAFFRLAYIEGCDQMTVIRTDEDGDIYERNGFQWDKIA